MDARELDRLASARTAAGDAPFAVIGDGPARFVDQLRPVLLAAGHPEHREPGPTTRLVLHQIEGELVRPYRRRSRATFVAAIVKLDEPTGDVLAAGYPYLVRALANLCVVIVPEGTSTVPYVVTPERGCYRLSDLGSPGATEAAYAHLAPLALSRLVIGNRFVPDLPPQLAAGDEQTRELARFGRRLDELGVLPAPFPLGEHLGERELRHLRLLFAVGGLSYGNLSARRDSTSFWMSASGVDKSRMRAVGHDIVLVGGLDAEPLALRIRVPIGLDRPARASVDAIEHWMIYERHPDVRAIVHIHAWVDGVPSTRVNYPCGTIELATEVADLVAAAPDPSEAIVGQKNHGLTLTGRSLDEIFDRLSGRVVPHVPMAA